MGESIHARRTPDGIRYRIWNTTCDQYSGGEMDETRLRRYLLDDYSPREKHYGVHDRDVGERIARANATGTSSHDDKRVLDGPWDTERCDGCGCFHHAFVLRPADGLCSSCGEPRGDVGHEKPCPP